MKVKDKEDQDILRAYCQFLTQLGDGTLPSDDTGAIQISKEFLLPSNDPNSALEWVYGDKPEPLPGSPEETGGSQTDYDRILKQNREYYKDKTVLVSQER